MEARFVPNSEGMVGKELAAAGTQECKHYLVNTNSLGVRTGYWAVMQCAWHCMSGTNSESVRVQSTTHQQFFNSRRMKNKGVQNCSSRSVFCERLEPPL